MATVVTPAGDEFEESSPAALHYYRREPGYLVDGVDETDPDYQPAEDVPVVDEGDAEPPPVDEDPRAAEAAGHGWDGKSD